MPERADILTFPGICDASAAVAIDEKTIIVGDDERQWLSIYDLRTQELLEKIPLPFHSGDDSGESEGRREADIEGATIFKGRIVWITSHGRNKSGKVRPDIPRDRQPGRQCGPGIFFLLQWRGLNDPRQ